MMMMMMMMMMIYPTDMAFFRYVSMNTLHRGDNVIIIIIIIIIYH
jgi:hypothetical protein